MKITPKHKMQKLPTLTCLLNLSVSGASAIASCFLTPRKSLSWTAMFSVAAKETRCKSTATADSRIMVLSSNLGSNSIDHSGVVSGSMFTKVCITLKTLSLRVETTCCCYDHREWQRWWWQ